MTSLISKLKKNDEQPQEKKEAVVPVKKTSTKKKVLPKFDASYRVLVRPLVSEKGALQQAQNKYFFEVARDTNKIEIKKAIETVYGVSVLSVNVLNQRGKSVRFGRTQGRRKAWKKAIVTLKKGDRITTVEGV